MSALKPLARLLVELLREDERRCLLGEDVGNGGMLGLSRAVAEDEQLRARLMPAPLTVNAGVAHAGGLALAGLRPIVILPSASALLEALPALRELGRLPWRSGEQHDLPVLFVVPNGPGFGIGGEAAESVEATLARVPGLELWTAGRIEELCACLRSAAEFDAEPSSPGASVGPRVLLLPRSVIVRDLIADIDLRAGLDRPLTATLRDGDQATVFAWGDALEPALLAAEACAAGDESSAGYEVRVVDVGRLAPLDEDALVEAASATGKLVIAHSGPRRHGLGAELAALFADRSILHLDAPVLRVCGEAEGLVSAHDEVTASPSAAAIADAIARVVHY